VTRFGTIDPSRRNRARTQGLQFVLRGMLGSVARMTLEFDWVPVLRCAETADARVVGRSPARTLRSGTPH
jgi:hypothetical protein